MATMDIANCWRIKSFTKLTVKHSRSKQFGVKVKYYREISSEDTAGFLRNETFFRQQVAALKDLEIIDKKLKVRLVR